MLESLRSVVGGLRIASATGACVALALLGVGCGQKGPLVLPTPASGGAAPASGAASAAVPNRP